MRLTHALYEPSGSGPYPALIAFHGWGSNALDLLNLAPHVARGRILVICPQGPLVLEAGGVEGYGWFPITGRLEFRLSDVEATVIEVERFLDEALSYYPIDTNRVGLLGFSQGGIIAYSLGFRHPERFAAVAALSSWLPLELLSWATDKSALKRLSVLVQHGSEDTLVPVERAYEAVANLRNVGVQLVYREHGGGHEVTAQSLQQLIEFLHQKLVSSIFTI